MPQTLTRNEMLLLSQLGFTLYKEGQYEKAISFFEGLSELQPELPQFHAVLALLYHLTNDPQQALRKALAAYRLKPNDIPLMLTMGEVYLTLNQNENAREILNRASAEARRINHPGLNRIILMLRSIGTAPARTR